MPGPADRPISIGHRDQSESEILVCHGPAGRRALMNAVLNRAVSTKVPLRIRPGTPLSLDDARRLLEGYVDRVRVNSAAGDIQRAIQRQVPGL